MNNKFLFALPLIASLTSVTLAGPTWDEGGGTGAGSLPPTSQPVAGSTKSPVTRISGTTSATGLVGPADPVDMFTVSTGSNPLDFYVNMEMLAGGNPIWNARLYLFKKVTLTCYTATGAPFPLVVAQPIAVVTRFNSSNPYPILEGSSVMANDSTKRLGDLLQANTEYFICVTGNGNEALFYSSYNGSCPFGSTANSYAFKNGEEATFGMWRPFYGSTGSTDMTGYALASWTNPATLPTGSYSNNTRGIYTVPASNCASTARPTGTSLIEFNFSFAPSVSTIMCSESVGRQFFYLWTSDCAGTVTVKTCGLTSEDTLISVYAIDPCNAVPCDAFAGTSINCNDRGCGHQSTVSFPAQIGQQFLVVLGRWNTSTPPVTATGKISFTCVEPNGSADLNHDGIVNGVDMAIFLGKWGTSGI